MAIKYDLIKLAVHPSQGNAPRQISAIEWSVDGPAKVDPIAEGLSAEITGTEPAGEVNVTIRVKLHLSGTDLKKLPK